MAVPSSFVLNGEGNAMGFEIFPNNHSGELWHLLRSREVGDLHL